MGWVKIDDDAYGNPKIVEAGGVPAFGAFVTLISLSHRYGTDGLISQAVAQKEVGSKMVKRLVAADLLQACEEGYRIPGYLQHQESAEQAKGSKLAYSEQQRVAGKARAAGAPRASSGQFGPGHASQKPRNTKSAPAGDQPYTTPHHTDTKDQGQLLSSSDDEGQRDFSFSTQLEALDRNEGFESVWKHYPRKVGKQAALEAYTIQRKAGHTRENLLLATQAFAADVALKKTMTEFIPHGAQFFYSAWFDYLPQERFLDEREQLLNGAFDRDDPIVPMPTVHRQPDS
jgi:hypothetical protein